MAARMSHNMRNLFECGRLTLESCLFMCVCLCVALVVYFCWPRENFSGNIMSQQSKQVTQTHSHRDKDAAAASTKVSQLQKYIHTQLT